MKKKSTGLLLSIIGVICVITMTSVATFAFFNYMKEGVTENTISTGTITFYYDEVGATGASINIENALPMTDEQGKALSGENEYFDFILTSEITGDAAIDYEITARKKEGSTLSEDSVKMYLETSATGTNYTVDDAGKVALFSDLDQTSVTNAYTEVTLFEGQVPARSTGATAFDKDFTLRMWIDGESDTTSAATDYSPYEFVLKTAATGGALNADELIAAGNLITSTVYYGKEEAEKANYERIAYVNTTTREVYTVSQVTEENGFTIVTGDDGVTTVTPPTGFVANEQFYALNDQTFTVTVNVYANAAVTTVTNPDTGA